MNKIPRTSTPRSPGRAGHSVKLFISYSHRNKVWMKHLTPLLDGFRYDDRLANRPRLQYLHAWHDKDLPVGNPWDGEIKQELEEMDIFVPLVSIDFFSSGYIQNVELPRARERHAVGEILVVPILLYYVNLREKCAFLHDFPAYPANDRLWSKYRDRREALGLIDDGLWTAIDAVLQRKATGKM